MATRDRGGPAIIDIARVVALALVALAVSAGLRVEAGLAFVPAMAAGVGLFLVLAAVSAWARRSASPAGGFVGAASGAEAAMPPSELADVIARQAAAVEQLVRRVQWLENSAVEGAAGLVQIGAVDTGALAAKAAKIDRLAAEVDRHGARLDALRSRFEIEVREQHETLAGELRKLEGLVAQLAERVAAGEDPDSQRPETAPSRALPRKGGGGRRGAAAGSPSSPMGEGWGGGASRNEESRYGGAPQPAQAAPAAAADGEEPDVPVREEAVLAAVRRAVEANSVELYLQPVVTLPQRGVRYYEALTRLRGVDGQLLMPKDFLPVAEAAGMLPLIDNVMLYRSVQVLRRLGQRQNERGVFCNISLQSLLDPDFFPEFIAFMEHNRSLAGSLFFEFAQGMVAHCGPLEEDSLNALAALGFRFGLDRVTSLDIDCAALQARGFRFVKVEAGLLLHRAGEAGARIHPADLRAYLERHGLELVVERIEDEHTLAGVLDLDVRLGQGFLFCEPRPVRPEVFGEGGAQAAA